MTYSDIIPFIGYFAFVAPILYLLFASALALWVKEFSFATHVVALGVATIIHFFSSIYFFDSILLPIITLVAGLMFYTLLVFFLGGKVSGETLFVVSATFILAPLPYGLYAIGIGLFLIIAFSAFSMRRQMSNFTSEIYAHMSVLSGGRPGYDLLPDRKLLERNTRKVYAAPFFLMGYAIVLLFVIIF